MAVRGGLIRGRTASIRGAIEGARRARWPTRSAAPRRRRSNRAARSAIHGADRGRPQDDLTPKRQYLSVSRGLQDSLLTVLLLLHERASYLLTPAKDLHGRKPVVLLQVMDSVKQLSQGVHSADHQLPNLYPPRARIRCHIGPPFELPGKPGRRTIRRARPNRPGPDQALRSTFVSHLHLPLILPVHLLGPHQMNPTSRTVRLNWTYRSTGPYRRQRGHQKGLRRLSQGGLTGGSEVAR